MFVYENVSVYECEYFFVYTIFFFVGRRAATLTLALDVAVVLFGAAGRMILSGSCCNIHVLYVPMYMYVCICMYVCT